MNRIKLSEQDDWNLVDGHQDIRGWPVRDEAGTEIGRVGDLLINEGEERVDALLLEDGSEVSAADVRIGDDAVTVRGAGAAASGMATPGAETGTVTTFDDYGRVVRRDRVEGSGSMGTGGTGSGGTGSGSRAL